MAEHKSPAECRRAAHVAELVALVKDDWPAFWRSLPSRELLAAAKAMPKIAGPWKAMPGEPTVYQRDAMCGAMGEEMTAAIDDPHAGLVHARAAWGDPWIRYPDRASADAALRAADWILVDEEGAT